MKIRIFRAVDGSGGFRYVFASPYRDFREFIIIEIYKSYLFN